MMAWVEQFQSVNPLHALACLVGAYALGCLGIGYYLVRAHTGRDIREMGSGSLGARNVGRVLGRSGFAMTLLADFAKGALAVGVVGYLTGSEMLAGMACLAVTGGHIWPVQLGFRGGKGVATSLGGLVLFNWPSVLIYVATFAILFALLRRTILPGLFAYLVLPFSVWWFRQDGVQVALVSSLVALVWFTHRENLGAEFSQLAGLHRAAPQSNKTEP